MFTTPGMNKPSGVPGQIPQSLRLVGQLSVRPGGPVCLLTAPLCVTFIQGAHTVTVCCMWFCDTDSPTIPDTHPSHPTLNLTPTPPGLPEQ